MGANELGAQEGLALTSGVSAFTEKAGVSGDVDGAFKTVLMESGADRTEMHGQLQETCLWLQEGRAAAGVFCRFPQRLNIL